MAVTTGDITKKDTVVIRVDYDVPPANSTLIANIPITDGGFVAAANNRDDTTNYTGYGFPNYYFNPLVGKRIYFERSRSNGAMVDSSGGKLYNTLEDGYAWEANNYARSQMTYGSGFLIDSNKTYVIELKFYFPQSVHDNMTSIGSPNWATFAIFGIHENDAFTGTGEIIRKRDSINWYDQKVGEFVK